MIESLEESPVDRSVPRPSPSRVGIIGCGQQGERHLRDWKADGAQVTWLCDIDEDRVFRLAHQLAMAHSGTTCDTDICTASNVDVVSIASYDSAHGIQAMMGLQNGKRVFCEKPFCTNREELRVLTGLVQGGGVIGCNFPLRLQVARLKALIEDGELGEIYAWESTYCWGRLEKLLTGWRAKEKGYSIFLGGAVHHVDLLLWLTGQKPTRVRAVGNKIVTAETAFRDFDYMTATFFCPSGLIATISAHAGNVPPHEHLINIYGTEGTARFNRRGLWVYRKSGNLSIHLIDQNEGKTLIPWWERLSNEEKAKETKHVLQVMVTTLAANEAAPNGESGEIYG